MNVCELLLKWISNHFYKQMKRTVISLLLAAGLLAPVAVLAQEASEARPGILPGNVLYVFDRLLERFEDILTLGNLNKAERALERASERIAELKAAAEADLEDGLDEISEDYEEKIEEASERLENARAAGEDVDERIEEFLRRAARHLEVLEGVIDKAPDAALERGLPHVLETSGRIFERHLENLSEQAQTRVRDELEEGGDDLEEALNQLDREMRNAEREGSLELDEVERQ